MKLSNRVKLPNEIYDALKWVLCILIPALIVLISKLGSIYNFATDTIIETIGAFATFFGVVLGISTINYYATKPQDSVNTDTVTEMIDEEGDVYEETNNATEE